MKSLENNMRLYMLVVLFLFTCVSIPAAHAQVTQTPSSLSFGIPTGSSPAVSAAQAVTVSIPVDTTVTFGTPTISGAGFSISGNGCQGSMTGPTTCNVSVTFASMLTTLQTGSLSIQGSGFELPAVQLSGAFGAIKLFADTLVEPSNVSATLSNPFVYGNSSLSLSCPAPAVGSPGPSPITALLSSTPDGSGYVLEDNYLSLAINGATVNAGNPAGNVCRGGPADNLNGLPLNDCFSSTYQGPAGGGSLNGQNPDTFASPNGTLGNAGGVTPIDISGFFNSGSLQASLTLLDGGGWVAGASLFLVTNCTVAGVAPGSTVVNNPINTADASTLTQTAAFDSTAGQNISLTTSYAAGVSAGTVTIPNGTTQRTVDIGIPQQLFSQLVANTSAAPSVCLRLSGELDSFGNAMCKGFLVQCSLNGGPYSGDNCVPTNSTVRNLFDSAKFASPDAPNDRTNYLGTKACQYFLGNSGACASTILAGNTSTLIGPGILLGSDNWTCAPGQESSSCTPQVANTTTPTSTATYSSANCVLTGGLTGDLCPLDTLTYFAGESDPTHGSTTTGKNSVFIPVVNMPLPFTVASVTNANASGWVNTATASASFQSYAANYPNPAPAAGIPALNGFAPAPPYSVTYGVSPASSPLPDSTYPVPGDISKFNTNANGNFGTPLCMPGTPAVSPIFNDSFMPGEGIYNLHYFTTDCALTEELLFNPTGAQLTDPAANWASFRAIAFGIDTTPPQVTCKSPATNVWYHTNQSVNCTVTDQDYVAGTSGSGFPPIVSGIQGSQSENLIVSTNVAPGTSNPAAPTTPTQACDLAGNCVNIPAGPFMIDMVAPTITGPTLSPAAGGNIYYVGGPAVTVTYTCSDGPTPPNSGIATCTGPLPSGSAIDTSGAAVGAHVFTVTTTDNAGNQSQTSVNYTVAYSSADLAIAASNLTEAETGQKLVYGFIASDLGPNAGLGVQITDTLPAGLTFVSASFTNGVTGGNCSNVGGTVTCTIGSAPVLPAKGSTYIGQITAKVTAKTGTVITNTISISGLNPDPKPGNNSSTVKVKVTN